MKKEFSLALGERTAEEIKIALGSAYALEEELRAEIRGRDLVTGLPKTIVITTEQIREAIEEPVQAIVDAIKVTLDRTPPELAADIMDQGIVLAGGGALLHGLCARIESETGDARRGGQGPSQLRRDREWSVPRGVRRPQAGAHHVLVALIRSGPWPSRGDAVDWSRSRCSLLAALTLLAIGGPFRTVASRAARAVVSPFVDVVHGVTKPIGESIAGIFNYGDVVAQNHVLEPGARPAQAAADRRRVRAAPAARPHRARSGCRSSARCRPRSRR